MNPEGITLGQCEYCGHCGRTACESNAKASPNVDIMPVLRAEPRFELRTRVFVTRLVYDKTVKRVTGVVYTDMKTGEEYEQGAGLVVLSSFVFGNTQQMMLAAISEPYDPRSRKGVLGKNYCYQFVTLTPCGLRGPVATRREAGVIFARDHFAAYGGGSHDGHSAPRVTDLLVADCVRRHVVRSGTRRLGAHLRHQQRG